MKSLIPAIVSASLLLGPALAFAQSGNDAMPATPAGTQTHNAYNSAAPQNGTQQPADLSYTAPRDNSAYGTGTQGSWQAGSKGMSRTLTEPVFGHH
jgi:hypothetical protein